MRAHSRETRFRGPPGSGCCESQTALVVTLSCNALPSASRNITGRTARLNTPKTHRGQLSAESRLCPLAFEPRTPILCNTKFSCTDMSRYTAFHSNLALLVVIVGIAGVLHDSMGSVPGYMNLHAVFGVLLWVSVVARFHRRLHQSPPMLPIEIREFSRHLSRLVYLMLYVLMFISLT